MRKRTKAATLLLALAALLPGCDLSSEDKAAPRPRPAEKVDKPAELPAGWRTEINRSAGFTVGVPPGWRLRPSGTSTVLTSPDRQVAISVSADRTDEALTVPLDRFAAGTAKSLSGFSKLKVGKPGDYKAHYPASRVSATGKLKKSGVRQRLGLVILRRPNLAAFPVLAATNVGGSPFTRQIDQIVRSLRGRPVTG